MADGRQNETWSTILERDLRPAYYDRFHCLAADCKLSCCIGWSIPFNKKDYLAMKHQHASPELTERLDRALCRIRDQERYGGQMYAEFDMSGGRCPLLREDSLCTLQAEKGPGALPNVCKRFPRTSVYLASGYLERSLTPACEGVLGLLWDLPEGIEFLSDPLPREKQCKLKAEGYMPLLRHYGAIRELCIDFLQDRRFPLPRRIMLMGMALKDLVDGETDIPGWLARSRRMAEAMADSGTPEEPEQEKLLVMFLSNNIQTLSVIETDDPTLKSVKGEVMAGCGLAFTGSGAELDVAPYRAARKRFEERFADRAYFFENLMVALLFHLSIPDPTSVDGLWKSYVNFCNLYAFYRFMAVMSCREGAAGDKDELFRMMIYASRGLIHSDARRTVLRDGLFQHGSATLAHMAVLLGG